MRDEPRLLGRKSAAMTLDAYGDLFDRCLDDIADALRVDPSGEWGHGIIAKTFGYGRGAGSIQTMVHYGIYESLTFRHP